MIKIDIDLSAENYEFNWKFLGPYINQGMRITYYNHIGPGGGNPNFNLEFPDRTLLKKFAEEYEGRPIQDLDAWLSFTE